MVLYNSLKCYKLWFRTDLLTSINVSLKLADVAPGDLKEILRLCTTADFEQ
jgi:hypothetical protein